MTLKNIYLTPIRGYQYVSKMLPANCRYYPTCSEYASWQFMFNAPHKALWASSIRILRCNQLFKGGIDYPIVAYTPVKTSSILTFNRDCGKIKVDYWSVPCGDGSNNYYIIKDFDAIKRTS